jgi:hypothetical protein
MRRRILREIPSTGSSGFDEGLRGLFQLKLGQAEETIRTAQGDVKKIIAGIGRDIVRVALTLEDDENLEMFFRADPPKLQPLFEEARTITRKLFGEVLRDPGKRAQLADALFEPPPKLDEYYASMGFVNIIEATSEWLFDVDEIRPRLRVLLMSPSRSVLLNSTLDWDDIVYVAHRLINEMRDDFKNLEYLTPEARRRIKVKSEFGDRVAKRMSIISKDLKVIRDKLCELGYSKDEFDLD